MEILGSILGSAVVETGKLFCGSMYSRIKYTVQFQSNLNDLQNQMKKLMDLSEAVKQQHELAERNGRSMVEVKKWLEEVVEVVTMVNSVQAAGLTADNQRLCGCFCHCTMKIRLGQKVAKLLMEVDRLYKADKFLGGMVSVNQFAKPVEYIPGPSTEDQTTASRNLAQLMKILDDDRYRRIGVWGMGGVGKTTLVRNLNNKLHSGSSNQSFSIVIWATVSKELDKKKVQKQIAGRLNLMVQMEDSIERTASQLYQRLLQEKKFLLILDDVWENIDLESLGIPQPEFHSGSRILLTSRLSDVCQQMMTNVEIKLNTLSNEEAWQLFSQKAGDIASLEHIKPCAEAVAKECCGLPLALIVVGTAMRGKTKIEVWKHALKELRRSVPCIRGVRDKVFNPLKWSYDSLEGNNIKACFLYCALFPEDFSIEVSELVACWLAEGLISEQQNSDESVNVNGIVIIETLKDCCLLEDGAREGTVKMHDVIRDVAIWIASSLEDGCKSLVCSGSDLREISEVDLSNSLKRVSFVNNKINKLPDCEMLQCLNATTLLLQGNLPLETVPERFLRAFKALRVLSMGGTNIQSLPPLFHLHDLRALLLGDCLRLEVLPPLEALSKLQVLDLRATRIRELPKEMETLIYLRQVDLSRTHYLKLIQGGIMSNWTCLEVLDMTPSAFRWDTKRDIEEQKKMLERLGWLDHFVAYPQAMKDNIEEEKTTLDDLSCLKGLVSLSIKLNIIPLLGLEYLAWMRRLQKFQFFIGDAAANFFPTRHDERRVIVSRLVLSGERIGWLLINASSLVLIGCLGLNDMLKDLGNSSVFRYGERKSFAGLKSLTISSCGGCISFPSPGRRKTFDLLPNLEELHLHGLNELRSLSELVDHLGLLFSKIKLIEVTECPRVNCLLYYDHLQTMPNLETIKVSFCNKLGELFQYVSEETLDFVLPIVPNLRILELKNLPKLRNLCRPEESWPRLEQVDVAKCYLLEKLPLNIQNASTIKKIRGESDWWSKLIWDNVNAELALQQYFTPIALETSPWRQKIWVAEVLH